MGPTRVTAMMRSGITKERVEQEHQKIKVLLSSATMFEASAARIFGTEAAQVAQLMPQAVYESSAVQVAQMQPYFWQGRSVGTVWGMQAEVAVRTMTTPDGTSVQVTVGAQVEQNALIVFILLCFFFAPA